jgi:prepilin-type N-terminal cleavage/methylation domain-containing protein
MRRGAAGFTLLEVLVALGILAVVIAIVSATFTGALGVQKAADRRVEVTHAGRTILDRVTQDLLSAFGRTAGAPQPPGTAPTPPGGLTLVDRELEGVPRDRLHLFTYARPLGGARERTSDRAQVEYDLVVSDDRRDWRLARRQTPRMQAGAAGEAAGDVLAERVVGFDVQVHDGREWKKTWDERSGRLPRAVSVTLRIAPDPGPGAHRPWGDGPIREAALWTYETKVVLPLAQQAQAQPIPTPTPTPGPSPSPGPSPTP